jgi:excinuclease UvrABC nuclease subunit
MIGTIIFVVAIALSLDTYFKERREEEERYIAELETRKQVLSQFVSEFGVDQSRAEHLYSAGFHKLEDFKDKSVQDLMQIDDINPTMAKRIVQRVKML